MRQTHKPILLTTRTWAAGAVLICGVQLLRDIRRLPHHEVGWLWPIGNLVHGNLLVALNVAFYLLILHLAFSVVRGSREFERAFFVGFFVSAILWPAQFLLQEWMVLWDVLGNVGMLIAFCASLALLIQGPQTVGTPER